MTEVKTDNVLIAEFMGHTFMAKYSNVERLAFREPFGKSWGHEPFNYAKRWDYLMPVVEKIREYRLAYPEQANEVCNLKIVVLQSVLYKRVVDFIKFLNEEKK